MASLEDLKNVLRETLEQKGVMNQIKSQIRAEIFTALDADNTQGKPQLPQENIMINELIREYLEFNQYYNTASVMVTETGQPQEAPFDRSYMERRMNIGGGQQPNYQGGKQVPLLYELVNGLQKTDQLDQNQI